MISHHRKLECMVLPTNSQCPFCDIEENRIILSNDSAIAFHDTFPLTAGHALVVPRWHVRSLYDLPLNAQSRLWDLVREVRASALKSGAEAVNIGLNDGAVAGQTLDHAHVHVIPRRAGDCPDPRGGIRQMFPAKARYWE